MVQHLHGLPLWGWGCSCQLCPSRWVDTACGPKEKQLNLKAGGYTIPPCKHLSKLSACLQAHLWLGKHEPNPIPKPWAKPWASQSGHQVGKATGAESSDSPFPKNEKARIALHLSNFRSRFPRQPHKQLHREDCRIGRLQWVAGERGEGGSLQTAFVFHTRLRTCFFHVSVEGPTTCEITCTPTIIFLIYCWVIPEKAPSQTKLQVWKSLAWAFWLLFCFLCERWAALPALCSLFAGDFYLTALLIPRWIGSRAA